VDRNANRHRQQATTGPVAPTRLRDALRDNGLATFAMVLVVGVAVAGWSASFISLHEFAQHHMNLTERTAWLVPSTFDGAALGLSLLAFRAAIYGRASLGSLLYVYGFTGLSSWINWVHIDDRAGGKFVSALLPIAAVLVFGKVLKEAREAYERRNGKAVFKVRPGLLLLRWTMDRPGTRSAIRSQILDIPVQALIGLGAGSLARDARAATAVANPAASAQTAKTPAVANANAALATTAPTTPTANASAANPALSTTANPAVANTPVANGTANAKPPTTPTRPRPVANPTAGDTSTTDSLVAAMEPAYRELLATTGRRPTAGQLVGAVDGINTESRAKQIRDVLEARFPEFAPPVHLVPQPARSAA
jgi:hypothetical protein